MDIYNIYTISRMYIHLQNSTKKHFSKYNIIRIFKYMWGDSICNSILNIQQFPKLTKNTDRVNIHQM